MLNAVEPGTVVAIHRRVAKDECFVVLRGKVGVTTHNDDGAIMEDVGVREERGRYGVDVSGGVCLILKKVDSQTRVNNVSITHG